MPMLKLLASPRCAIGFPYESLPVVMHFLHTVVLVADQSRKAPESILVRHDNKTVIKLD
jgi:hypothetical protein